ncbi:TonB-dependent receptor plug domain-containing protein [Spirochaetia bacterium 38H-sp]|uniref:TonB-dependent receptor plug domain-containing protein n=1 Tax=Rarispira pelagica TaxID=3141764 RepID=A0ABU9UC30_9SPIR
MRKTLLIIFFVLPLSFIFSQQDGMPPYANSSSLSFIADMPIYVIDTEDIASSSARTISDLLATKAFVFLYNKGRVGEISMSGMAGSPAGYIEVMINGVPYKLLTIGRAEIPPIPVSAVERIEIYKGPELSGIYSQGAIAGAINIVTRYDSDAFLYGKIGLTAYPPGRGVEIYDNSGSPDVRDYETFWEDSLLDTVYLDGAITPLDGLIAAIGFISSANDFYRSYSPEDFNRAIPLGVVDSVDVYANDNNIATRISGSIAYSFSVGSTGVSSFSYAGLTDAGGPVALIDKGTFYDDTRWTLYTQWGFSSVSSSSSSSFSVVARYDDNWISSWGSFNENLAFLEIYRLAFDYKKLWAYSWGRAWILSSVVTEFSESHAIGEPVMQGLFKLGGGFVWYPLPWLEVFYSSSYSVSPVLYWTLLKSDGMTLILPWDSSLRVTASPYDFATVFVSASHSFSPFPSIYGLTVPVSGDPSLYGGYVSSSAPAGMELFTLRGGADFSLDFADLSVWADYVFTNNMPVVDASITPSSVDTMKYDIFYVESVLRLAPWDFMSAEFMVHYAPFVDVPLGKKIPDPYYLVPVWAVPLRLSTGLDFYVMGDVFSIDVLYNGDVELDLPYDTVVSSYVYPGYVYVEVGGHFVLPMGLYFDVKFRNALGEDYYVNPVLKGAPISLDLAGGIEF